MLSINTCVFIFPGRVRPAETRQPPRATLPGTFSHQVLPAGASPAQPAEGASRPPWNASPGRRCRSHWFFSMLPPGHHGRADAGRVGEVHHRGAPSVQRLDALGHPAGALGHRVREWTPVLPGCPLKTCLLRSSCVLSTTAARSHKPLQLLGEWLGEDGLLQRYGSPSQPSIELRRVALTCLANICLR